MNSMFRDLRQSVKYGMFLITDNSKYNNIPKANPSSKYSTTITTPITVHFSTDGELVKVTFVS